MNPIHVLTKKLATYIVQEVDQFVITMLTTNPIVCMHTSLLLSHTTRRHRSGSSEILWQPKVGNGRSR